MTRKPSIWRRFSPYQLLLFGYAVITLTGALLLSLPVSSAHGTSQPFLDALFLATSGISTTGLSVVDIGSYYSVFGQIVLLIIFQIGGIGYMTFVIIMMYLLGIRGSIRTSLAARESLAGSDLQVVRPFLIDVLRYTAIFEGAGALMLTLFWMKEYPFLHSVYLGIFHSVSAFCTAGFCLFPDSVVRYQHSYIMNGTIIGLSLAGGVGFFVLRSVKVFLFNGTKRRRMVRLTAHTKIVLTTTALLVAAGTAVIFVSEDWPDVMDGRDAAAASFFQAVSASTTDGFNSIDIGEMSAPSLTTIMFLMFIGASPGSTGGGIKTTTFALLLILLWARFHKKENNVFGREISEKCVYDAIVVFLSFLMLAFLDTLILSVTESASYSQVMFEIFSALGNTGLSTGITTAFSPTGKLVLIITMFVGRVGILMIASAILVKPKKTLFRYPKEDIFIG